MTESSQMEAFSHILPLSFRGGILGLFTGILTLPASIGPFCHLQARVDFAATS